MTENLTLSPVSNLSPSQRFLRANLIQNGIWLRDVTNGGGVSSPVVSSAVLSCLAEQGSLLEGCSRGPSPKASERLRSKTQRNS